MLQIFNCGIGYILLVPPEQAGEVVDRLRVFSMEASVIGEIAERSRNGDQVVINF
jgi:phosphoribosylformylglycinamidine cyclo-ligase